MYLFDKDQRKRAAGQFHPKIDPNLVVKPGSVTISTQKSQSSTAVPQTTSPMRTTRASTTYDTTPREKDVTTEHKVAEAETDLSTEKELTTETLHTMFTSIGTENKTVEGTITVTLNNTTLSPIDETTLDPGKHNL